MNCSKRLNTFAACLTFRPVAFINDGTVALYDMSHGLGAIETATKHTMAWFSGLPILPSNHHFILVEPRSLSVLRYMRLMSLYNVAKYSIQHNSIQHNIRVACIKGRKYKSNSRGIKQNK